MNPVFKYAALTSFSTLIFAHTASSQQASDVEALQHRMDSLESKVDALVDLIQKQQMNQRDAVVSKNVPQTARSGKSNIPDGFVSGMHLDVYASNISISDNMKWSDFSMPKIFPSASVDLPAESSFPYGQFLTIDALKNFGNTAHSLVGVSYSSLFWATTDGEYAFQLNISANKHNTCVMQTYLSDKRIMASGLPMSFGSSSDTVVASEQTKVKLNSGLYELTTYFFCSHYQDSVRVYASLTPPQFDQVKVELLMAEPGDRAPHPIPADRLLIKQ